MRQKRECGCSVAERESTTVPRRYGTRIKRIKKRNKGQHKTLQNNSEVPAQIGLETKRIASHNDSELRKRLEERNRQCTVPQSCTKLGIKVDSRSRKVVLIERGLQSNVAMDWLTYGGPQNLSGEAFSKPQVGCLLCQHIKTTFDHYTCG